MSKAIDDTTYWNEHGYIDLLSSVLCNGKEYPDRTGIGCRKLFNARLAFDLSEGFPKATVRKTPLRLAFEELWLFLRGNTDTRYLENKGIYFWQEHTSRQFLDSRGMHSYSEGDMGTAYGYQLRNFAGSHDQLSEVFENLRDNPFSRRHYVTMWCPSMNETMALLPCWHSHEFNCEIMDDGEIALHLNTYSRSSDSVFGLPFNYQQYALYLTAMAKALGYKPGVLMCHLSDVHIYRNQYSYARETAKRGLDSVGTREIKFNKPLNSLEDILSLQWENIVDRGQTVNTKPYEAEKPSMAT